MTRMAVKKNRGHREASAAPLFFSLMAFIHKQTKFIPIKDKMKVGIKEDPRK
jgi:hypothetical protein